MVQSPWHMVSGADLTIAEEKNYVPHCWLQKPPPEEGDPPPADDPQARRGVLT